MKNGCDSSLDSTLVNLKEEMLERDILSVGCKSMCLTFAFLLYAPLVSAQDAVENVDFVKSVKPILEKYCVSCHGEIDPDSFRIDIKDEAMDYLVEGSSDDSDIYLVMVSEDEDELMPPPDEENPMAENEIELIKAWIDQGADWPDGVKLSPVSTETDDVETQSPDEPSAPGKSASDVKPTPADGPKSGKKEEAVPEVNPKTQRVYNAIGSLHPAVIHLPIGLLLAAGLFALFSLRGNFVMSDCAYYCLWLGALGSIAACITGWWFSPMENVGTVNEFNDLFNQDHRVFWHRTSGLIVTAIAFLLALFAAGARNRDPDDGVMWKLGLILVACGIGWVGHEGGELTHGKHLYDDLKAIVSDFMPGTMEEEKPAEDAESKAGDQPPENPNSDADEVGKASDET